MDTNSSDIIIFIIMRMKDEMNVYISISTEFA